MDRFGEAAANEQMAHEQEHVDVYQQYGIPVRYGFAITKTPIGDRYIPFVAPEFPPGMDAETQRNISIEAAGRPEQLSDGDRAFLENLKKAPLNNSVGSKRIIQSFPSEKSEKTTEFFDSDSDEWRFEIKRKKRDAGRKNSGSTAKAKWYYWVIRIRKGDGETEYYGTIDVLDAADPERLEKYWKRSKKGKKDGRTRG